MPHLIHDLIFQAAARTAQATALVHKERRLSYAALAQRIRKVAGAWLALGLGPGERVAVYLDKQIETVEALFGATAAGATMVPVNPLLKPHQVRHILQDCQVRILVTSGERLRTLAAGLCDCSGLHTLIVTGKAEDLPQISGMSVLRWEAMPDGALIMPHRRIDNDMAAILYTSGSTGQPKGVVLSHRNLVAGAASVAGYLENTAEDRILSVLPLSFDYGLSQLTTAFHCGATAVLMNYLLPQDIVRAVREEGITGLAGVPPLWGQLARLVWPDGHRLRYITNSGGAMQRPVLERLRAALPDTRVYLMYGLTEAFRSTYLPPDQLDRRPDSIGKAIPHAEVMVVRSDGTPCAAGEPGELVHRGALVALGYWNDPVKTAERFRPAPGLPAGLPLPEMAVWSGDTVRQDEDGYLYFIGRRDDMIKVSGYRISSTEIEEVLLEQAGVMEAAVFGVPHPLLGQAIVAVIQVADSALTAEDCAGACRRKLPAYMVPAHIVIGRDALPRNANGKLDRQSLQRLYAGQFNE